MSKLKGGHILNADIMLTPDGPLILELTPRLSGGWDSTGTTPARGADFVGGALHLALGEILDLDFWSRYFAYENPSLYSAVLAQIQPGAKDCIGRDFALGSAFERNEALTNAHIHLKRKQYVLSVEQRTEPADVAGDGI